jgi:hypothetical protein
LATSRFSPSTPVPSCRRSPLSPLLPNRRLCAIAAAAHVPTSPHRKGPAKFGRACRAPEVGSSADRAGRLDESPAEPVAPRRHLELPAKPQRCGTAGEGKVVRDGCHRPDSGGRLGVPEQSGMRSRSRIGSRSMAPYLRARLPEAKRSDQGGVVWGNPSDAFLIHEEPFRPGMDPLTSCPNKNAAGNFRRRKFVGLATAWRRAPDRTR